MAIYEMGEPREVWRQIFERSQEEYRNPEDVPLRINFDAILVYLHEECYREEMVSFLPMKPMLILPQVRIEDADYIIYMNPYARCEDVSARVLEDLRKIDQKRHDKAEIIVVGKAANAEKLLKGSISRITFWGDHFTEKLGKKFGIDMTDQYFVYDPEKEHLAIWPVDGCNNHCKFCRRTYMYIKFESLPLDVIKAKLDEIKDVHPEWLKTISLRAENLTEYGLDIYGEQKLADLIRLIDSYKEVKEIGFPIGINIGEVTDDILQALCECKLKSIYMNPECGTDRMLQFIGKGHTVAKAKQVFKAIREAHPNAAIYGTVMIGLPTEEQKDIFELAKLIGELKMDYVMVNYYVVAKGHPLAAYPQMSNQVKEYHLKILRKELPKYLTRNLLIHHWTILKGNRKRSIAREMVKIKKENEEELFPLHLGEHQVWVVGDRKWYYVHDSDPKNKYFVLRFDHKYRFIFPYWCTF